MGAAVGDYSLKAMKSHPTPSSARKVACWCPASRATHCNWMARPTRAFCMTVRLRSSTARLRLVLARNAAAAAAAPWSLKLMSRHTLPWPLGRLGVAWVIREGS